MSPLLEELHRVLAEMAVLIDKEEEPEPQLYAIFFQRPEYAFQIIELLNNLDEEAIQARSPIYSACIFAFDICLAQLQAASENHNKSFTKALTQLMNQLAGFINEHRHSLTYWLPVLNAFYDVHAELTQELKDAYFDLANEEGEEDDFEGNEQSHLDAIRDLIHELSDLSIFEIAEHFFAQSYAMPADFFIDLVMDLFSLPEGGDIALLTLLHPKAEVRETVLSTLEQLMPQISLSSISLSRLQTIQSWYPARYQATFDRWIKAQRKKGVIFAPELPACEFKVKATEVDGSGSQGLFIHAGKGRKNRLGGLLLKYQAGIKDTWITPEISAAEVADYYHQAFEENVTLRDVDSIYFKLMLEHFLAVTIAQGDVPNLYFLELHELLALRFRPNTLDIESLFTQLSVEISPFTEEVIAQSFKRSKSWLKNKPFTESWYLESAAIDKIVNHNSSYVDGIKICRLADAIQEVFIEAFESDRARWQFHFLWVALWLKAKEKKNEKSWQDSFLIAHAIKTGHVLKDIPVMQEICKQTVINSIETMQERKTYLNKE
ncbi:MAG: hypothetical protein CK426_07850 [Legionella sp.]|nr:MAG: hypothetical protein CK423_00755 [Legionella sp.]PJD97347.1 MAG: hypothetical protein CK426_07850 [Legionella sp.]